MKRIRRIAITVLALMISASSVFAFVQEISLQSTVHRLQPGNVSSQTDQYAYMPYGVATHTGNSQTPYQWLGGFRLRYSTARQDGVYYDHTTDLHLTLHRAYSSDMRKFISPDPLGIDGGVNVYAYANLNPLFFVDPLGLCADVGEIRAPRYSSNRPFWLNLLTNPGETMMHNFVEHNGGIHNISDADWNRQYKLAEQSQMTTEIAIMTAMGTVSEVPAGARVARAAENFERAPAIGQRVYRVWGQNPATPDLVPQQSGAWGRSWTRVDPRTVPNYRSAAGLPNNANLGRFVSEGRLIDPSGITVRDALRIGNNAGGLDELVVPNPVRQIILDNVSGVNPSF